MCPGGAWSTEALPCAAATQRQQHISFVSGRRNDNKNYLSCPDDANQQRSMQFSTLPAVKTQQLQTSQVSGPNRKPQRPANPECVLVSCSKDTTHKHTHLVTHLANPSCSQGHRHNEMHFRPKGYHVNVARGALSNRRCSARRCQSHMQHVGAQCNATLRYSGAPALSIVPPPVFACVAGGALSSRPRRKQCPERPRVREQSNGVDFNQWQRHLRSRRTETCSCSCLRIHCGASYIICAAPSARSHLRSSTSAQNAPGDESSRYTPSDLRLSCELAKKFDVMALGCVHEG